MIVVYSRVTRSACHTLWGINARLFDDGQQLGARSAPYMWRFILRLSMRGAANFIQIEPRRLTGHGGQNPRSFLPVFPPIADAGDDA